MTEHGAALYKRGCRCEVCTEGNRVYIAEYRRVHGIARTKAQIRAERRYEAKRKAARRATALIPTVARVIDVRRVALMSAGDD